MSFTARFVVLVLVGFGLAACGGGGGPSVAPTVGLGQPPTQILTVTNHDDDGPGSLRQAVADAPPGAWVVFDPGLVVGIVQLATPIEITKIVTIGGLTGAGTRHKISGQAASQVFIVNGGGLQLNDLIIEEGFSLTAGGAIEAYDAPVVCWRTAFVACFAQNVGGAVLVQNGSLNVYDSAFTGNITNGAAGAVAMLESDARIERSSFYMNAATQVGGALRLEGGTTTVVNSSFHENEANGPGADGGAISVATGPVSSPAFLRAFNVTATQNTATSEGGGIYVNALANPAEIELHRCIVALNNAGNDTDIAYGAGSTDAAGSYNFVGVGDGKLLHGLQNNQVGDGFAPLDPMMLAPFSLPDGRMVSLPLPAGPCVDTVPAGQNPNPEGFPMLVDLRFLPRDPGLPSDLGCCEL